jgi:hypothetical protein
MASRSVRRSAIVLTASLAIGVTAAVTAPFSHAQSGGHTAHSAGPVVKTKTVTVAKATMVRAQLVRNSGFQESRRFWTTSGVAHSHLHVARPGYHSGHSAQLIAKRSGSSTLSENLPSLVKAGDRYEVSAKVKIVGKASTVALQLRRFRGHRWAGIRSVRVRPVNHRWTSVQMSWDSVVSGLHLVVDVRDRTAQAPSGVRIDNVRVVRIRKRVPHRRIIHRAPPTPAPTSTPVSSPSPTPTGSSPAPVTPTPTPTPTAGTTAPTSCTVSAILVPSCGIWWGAYKHPSGSETWVSTVTDLQTATNENFGIVYRYRDFSGKTLFPDSADKQLAASGHILLEDWSSKIFSTGTHVQWADIASGKYDASVIDPEAAYIKAYGQPVMLSFDHEMDTLVGTAGQPADYVAAYQHVYNVFASMGVTNVIWVWTITGYSGHDSEYKALYPGNAYVDWIGYDPYNFAACHSTAWKSFNQTVDPAYQWLESNGFGDKPFILPEYGTVPDASNSAAESNWYSQIPSVLAAHPNIKATVQWDDSTAGCDTQLTTGPGELAAFAAAGQAVASTTPGKSTMG